jgi:hypothetical protein
MRRKKRTSSRGVCQMRTAGVDDVIYANIVT